MQTMIFRTKSLTPEDAEQLHEYIATLPALPLLTPEQEAAADPTTLVERNIRLSIITACKYAGRGVPVVDLVQEGNIGLMRAAETFDASKSRFSTYALQAIAHAVRRAVANQGNVMRLPVWSQDGSKRADISERAREVVNTRTVVSADAVAERANARGAVSPMHRVAGSADTEAEAIDRVAADERRTIVAELLDVLPPRERQVIDLYVLRGIPLREVAAKVGCSHESIRTIVSRATKRMRDAHPEARYAL